MGWPQSLQGRLSLWLGLGLLLAWSLAAAMTAHRLRGEMDVVFDSALEEAAQRLLPLAARDILDRDADDAPDQRVDTLRLHDEYFTYVIRDRAGTVLMRSHSANPADFPTFSDVGFADTRRSGSIPMPRCKAHSPSRWPSRWPIAGRPCAGW